MRNAFVVKIFMGCLGIIAFVSQIAIAAENQDTGSEQAVQEEANKEAQATTVAVAQLRRDARHKFLQFDVKRYDAKKLYRIEFNSAALLDHCMGANFDYDRCDFEVNEAHAQLDEAIIQARRLAMLEEPKQEIPEQTNNVVVIQQNYDDDLHTFEPGYPPGYICSGRQPTHLPAGSRPSRGPPRVSAPAAPPRSAPPTAPRVAKFTTERFR